MGGGLVGIPKSETCESFDQLLTENPPFDLTEGLEEGLAIQKLTLEPVEPVERKDDPETRFVSASNKMIFILLIMVAPIRKGVLTEFDPLQ